MSKVEFICSELPAGRRATKKTVKLLIDGLQYCSKSITNSHSSFEELKRAAAMDIISKREGILFKEARAKSNKTKLSWEEKQTIAIKDNILSQLYTLIIQ